MKIKICGLTRLEDARLALELGAQELGFIFAPSPRRISPELAASILAKLRSEREAASFRAVGVFVDEELDTIRDIQAFCALDLIQLHGGESPEACESLGLPWYRALRIAEVSEALLLLSQNWACPRILIDAPAGRIQDAKSGGRSGSLGTWAALAARKLAREAGKEFFVAGGLRAHTVAASIHSLAPDGLDISSGIEESPGKKSESKMRELFAAIGKAETERLEYSSAAR